MAMRTANAEYQKRWRDKRNELARWAAENKREVFTAETFAQMKQDVVALKAENAGLRQRVTQLEAQEENWSWQDDPTDIARVMLESHPHKAPQVFSAGLNLYKPTAPAVQPKRRGKKVSS
jgi:hypothetical protein